MGYDFTSIYNSSLTISLIETRLNSFTNFGAISDSDREMLPEFAAVIAKAMHNKKKPVTPTQLRRFYTYIKSIDLANQQTPEEITNFKDKYKLKFILPKIAGSSERESLEDLYKILNACITGNKIQSVKDFWIFMEFFEAILDYHSTFKPQKQDN